MTIQQIRITGTGSELQGVGRADDGRAVFVPGALPGECVEVEIIRQAPRFCEGRVVRVLEASDARREPDCPCYGRCGGCHARHMQYAETLKLKRQRVYDALTRIGGLTEPVVRETLGCAQPDRTRNKAEFPIVHGKIGAYAAGSHALVPLEDCLLQREPAVRALRWFAKKLPSLSCASHLTALVTRVNRADEMMLTVCADAPVASEIEKLLPELRRDLPELVSVYFLRQNRRPSHALDGACTHLWGAKALEETLHHLKFELSPQSFFQVNPDQAERLYDCALEAAGLTESSDARVLDAYCGVGTITLAAAQRAAHVIGVEIVPPAIADARENARRNGLSNRARFILGDAAAEIPKLIAHGEHFDAAILDPPRKGADEKLLDALIRAGISTLSYVSCDPATLARDVKRLTAGGYLLQWAQPVDMFPWTGHVETVVLMSRVKE